MEGQRKRTLEALERRFAQAEVELQNSQQKKKKYSTKDDERFTDKVDASFTSTAAKKPFHVASSRKGNISFSGQTSKLGAEVNEPAYLKLSHALDQNLLRADAEVSDSKATVDSILHDLFQHGDAAQKYMQGSKSIKIENTILLDNYVQRSGMSTADHIGALQNRSKRSKKHMSLKQHKKCGSFNLPQKFYSFEVFKPMHENWKSYMQQLLKIAGKDQLAQCFLNADLHGAIILVVQCKAAAYTGIHGIVIRETKNTFGIITKDNKFRVVPKKPSVFVLQADCWKVTLYGDKLTSRSLVP